ncbi:MAG: tetratricopeptide repeat protein [Saprospiraceae bacterium]|nr:tetratricopeptide repeat protein [Saprospiraceae bacterium]
MEKATLAAEWEKYQQQLQQNPLHLPSLIAMADLLFDNGKAELAVPYYQKITELQPDYPKAWYRLGRILLDQQPEAATPTLEKALRLIPTTQKRIACGCNCFWRKPIGSKSNQRKRENYWKTSFANIQNIQKRSIY